MADGTTSYHSFILPEVGASRDTWGTKVNQNFVAIDALLRQNGDPTNGGKFARLTGTNTFQGQQRFDNDILPFGGYSFAQTGIRIYTTGADGIRFNVNGTLTGFLEEAGGLSNNASIVTRAQGDARYLLASGTNWVPSTRQVNTGNGLSGGGNLSANRTLAIDTNIVMTLGAVQEVTGAKTFSNNVTLTASSGTVFLDSDTSTRYLITANRNGSAKLHHRLTAEGNYELWAVDNSTLRIIAPMIWSVGSGEVFVERHADDGDGTGVCIRASTNPTTGHIFSVRSQGGALGLGVGQDRVATSRANIYVGSTSTGSGGDPVLHAGTAANAIGQMVFAKQNSGGTMSPGNTTAGSNLNPAGDDPSYAAGTTLPGTWKCLGYAQNGRCTLFQRVS